MRHGLLVVGIAGCVGVSQGWIARTCDHASTAALTDEARLAIDVRCARDEGRAARECRSMLKKLYLSGALDPDKTLRTYCDSFEHARWGGSRPAPPALCRQRYGGWGRG
jgi:hypothetical protein